MKNQYRFLARIIVEAKSPLNIGSGNKGIKSDSLVLRDINGLPFIPGTTIAGLLRHTLGEEEDLMMGSQEMGSPLIITEAKMLDSNESVLDGIIPQEKLCSDFLVNFRQLPIRQHAKIGHRGATVKGGKFDEEIVLKGTRFCFEMEMLSDKDDDTRFIEMLNTLNSDVFRIGSGSRSGFGEIEVVGSQCQYKKINLEDPKQKEWYLKKSSSLSEEWQDAETVELKKTKTEGWTTYIIKLNPVDFMLFGSGFGNDKADMTFVRESFVDWSTIPAKIKDREQVILIPASSVKGALSHRLAFHYNKLKKIFADALPDGKKIDDFVCKKNEAVKIVLDKFYHDLTSGDAYYSNAMTEYSSKLETLLNLLDYNDASKIVFSMYKDLPDGVYGSPEMTYYQQIGNLIRRCSLFNPSFVKELISASPTKCSDILDCDKPFYDAEDLRLMKEILSLFATLPVVGKIEVGKNGMFSKEKELFVCQHGHKNEKDYEFCDSCGENIKGLTRNHLKKIEQFKLRVETLERLMG